MWNMRLFSLVLACLALALTSRCTPAVCAVGQVQSCSCVQGHAIASGQQTCSSTGAKWEDCRCDAVDASEPTYRDGSEHFLEPSTPEPVVGHEPFVEFPHPPEHVAEHGKENAKDAGVPERPSTFEGKDAKPGVLSISLDTWFRGAKAAVSLTIDEGVASPYKLLAPEIERFGWRGTFYVYSLQPTLEKTWDLIKAAHLRGHEISCHTHTHPDLTKINQQRIHDEMKTCISELRKMIAPDLLLLSFSYPFENTDARVWNIVKQYHRYARGGDHGVPVPPNPVPLNDATAPDWGNLQAKAPTRVYSVPQWNGWVGEAVRQGKWLIEELHGVEQEGWEPRTLDEYKSHFRYIEKRGDVWVGTVADVGRYIEERVGTKWRIVSSGPREVVLRLFHSLSTSVYTVPLSYVVTVPTGWGWRGIKVVQGGREMRVEALGGGRYRTESVPDTTRLVRITPL